MDCILFDLDNTLYSPRCDLFSLIDKRINNYMHEVVGIPLQQVDTLRRRYWQDYGVTMQGLMRHHQVDPEDYLHYVHDVNVGSRLHVDPELRKVLVSLPQTKVIFTNSSRAHVDRVLDALGVADLFDEVFDIRVADYLPKPYPEPYRRVLDNLGMAGERCMMVEDSVANLKPAKELGMVTILVGHAETEPFVDRQLAEVVQLPEILAGGTAAGFPSTIAGG
ncbi:MAG: putative hydrolase of the superfamily [Desulfuromonadales bacterium]|jgi:putative hydrolase of the HAD superfamily|nr:putative hydrolase of the superfamily [Desulfuromonadales bacterium]